MNDSVVTISQAAGLLGVSEVTLRHWTDEGKIEAFFTPGGHRRYLKSELDNFITSHRKSIGPKDLVARIEATGKLHSEISKTSLTNRNWYNLLREDEKMALSRLGRQMLNVIISYLNEPPMSEETLEHAREVGRSFGKTLANLGLPLIDSVEMFILHRDPIMTAIALLIEKGGVQSGKIFEAIPLTDRIFDETLVSLVAAHQQAGNSARPEGSIGLE